MNTTVARDRKPVDHERGERPVLRPAPARTTPGEVEPRSFDPTQGRQSGSNPYDDPTQGQKIGSDPYDDPTRAGYDFTSARRRGPGGRHRP